MTSTTANVETFLLPDVGEGLTEADIVDWHVEVGETVVVNQVLVDIETAKSVVELPSPYAGEVVELISQIGETVPVGSPIIAIRTGVSTSGVGEPPDDAEPAPGPLDDDPEPAQEEPKLLVGYGAKETSRRRRRSVTDAPTHTGATDHHKDDARVVIAVGANRPTNPRAKPPVRKLAKEMGVNLSDVEGSGKDGVVTRSDVVDFSQTAPTTPDDAATPTDASASARLPNGQTRIPIKGVRKLTAAAMVKSAFTAPHVTEFVTIDVTKTLELRDAVMKRREFRDIKLTPLAFVARAYVRALTNVPMATARWDEAAQELLIPEGVNLGIAAATPRGLLVPNIRSAHMLGLRELATAINDLAQTARDGKTLPDAMFGGNATITNVGVFGVDTGTPILNPGETTILAVGAIRRQPWIVEDADGERMEPRSVLQLALSFDHRVLDGAEGSQVLADTAAVLAEPGLALL